MTNRIALGIGIFLGVLLALDFVLGLGIFLYMARRLMDLIEALAIWR